MHFNGGKHWFYVWSVFICVNYSISVVKAAITMNQLGVMCIMVLIQVNFIVNLAISTGHSEYFHFLHTPSAKRAINVKFKIHTSVKRYKKYRKYKKKNI